MSLLRKAEKKKALLEKQQNETPGGEKNKPENEANLAEKGITDFFFFLVCLNKV